MSASAGGDGTPSEGAGRTGQRITGNGSDYAGGYAGGVQPCRGCADEGERGGSGCGQKKQCRTDAVRYPQYQSVRSFHFPGRE